MGKNKPKLFSMDNDRIIPHSFNTGTIYDLLTGKVVQGYDGKYYIAGGLCNHINGLYGPPNAFKSSVFDSFMARVHAIYGGDSLIGDSEGAKDEDPERLVRCAGELGPHVDTDDITYCSGGTVSIDKLFEEVKKACLTKSNNQKDCTFETPFLDMKSGKRAKAWIPTIIALDSWSEMFSEEEMELLDSQGLGGNKVKTIFMSEGAKKTMFIRQIRRWSEQYGLVVLAVAHKGNNNANIDTGMPAEKKTQQMKQGDALKNVGSKFYDLTRTLMEIAKATELKDNNNEPLYKYGKDTPPKDVNEVQLKTIRCKSNLSGPAFPLVASQNKGLLTPATHYHYLRQNGYSGLQGNKQRHSCALKPDVSLTRNSVRENADRDYELARALEICARMLVIQNYWVPIPELEDVWHMTLEDVYEKLKNNKSPKISDILNSVGYWTPDGTCEREYMSIFDILKLLQKGK